MLDTLHLELTLDKTTYATQIEALMRQMRSLQQACWEKKLPAIVVLEGWAAAGKGSVVKKMVAYMDPRGFAVHPIWPPSPEEMKYPFLRRFWGKLPRRGSIGFFYHSWYIHILEDRLFERIEPEEVPMVMQQINAFERQLVDDGAAIAKFWIHLSHKELKRRLKKYADDPLQSWRVRPEDWQQQKHYNQYVNLAEEMLIHTSTGPAPWTLVEGNCPRWTKVKVLTQLAATLTESLDRLHSRAPVPLLPPQEHLTPAEPDYLAQVDVTAALSRQDYKQQLRKEQVLLRQLQLNIHQNQIPVLVLFEGWDAAGKGGAIGIFDRSWYGRVLVERIEGFAADNEWRRAYQEINEFEAQLTGAGYVLVKFWLHVSPEKQLERFMERQNDPFKQYKLTQEDWRNRDKWPLYSVAVNQMIQRTSTPTAPWTLIPANDKYYARVKVIQTVIQAIGQKLKGK
jgi:polyphosphate kinase 2 (PPK2 family)